MSVLVVFKFSCSFTRGGNGSLIQDMMWCKLYRHCFLRQTGQNPSLTPLKDSWPHKRCYLNTFIFILFTKPIEKGNTISFPQKILTTEKRVYILYTREIMDFLLVSYMPFCVLLPCHFMITSWCILLAKLHPWSL